MGVPGPEMITDGLGAAGRQERATKNGPSRHGLTPPSVSLAPPGEWRRRRLGGVAWAGVCCQGVLRPPFAGQSPAPTWWFSLNRDARQMAAIPKKWSRL